MDTLEGHLTESVLQTFSGKTSGRWLLSVGVRYSVRSWAVPAARGTSRTSKLGLHYRFAGEGVVFITRSDHCVYGTLLFEKYLN